MECARLAAAQGSSSLLERENRNLPNPHLLIPHYRPEPSPTAFRNSANSRPASSRYSPTGTF